MILATKQVCGGKVTLQQKRCTSCGFPFWTKDTAPRSECADCNPPLEMQEALRGGMGRNLDRKASDRQYHGGNYRE